MMSNWHWHWHCQWSILGTVRSRTTHLARNREGDQLQVFTCASISSTLHFRSSILSASLSPHKASDMALWWPTWWPIWRWTRWLTWESNLVRELITGVNWAQTFFDSKQYPASSIALRVYFSLKTQQILETVLLRQLLCLWASLQFGPGESAVQKLANQYFCITR